jgi:hypothetical protein
MGFEHGGFRLLQIIRISKDRANLVTVQSILKISYAAIGQFQPQELL